MTCDEVAKLIEAGIPGAKAKLKDLTGTGDHFSADVVAEAFAGKSMLAQHRMVYEALGANISTPNAPIHALQLNTKAP